MSKNTSAQALNILHITDCHLTKDADGELLGVNTQDSLNAVLECIAADGIDPDLVIASGDLAQDASFEAYGYFKAKMAAFDCPVAWFPGNHDQRQSMKKAIGRGDELQKSLSIGDWRFVFLDSLVEGSVHGRLSNDELALLEKELAMSNQHTMVCMHHHPVDIGSIWLDKIGLHNRDDFWAIVDKHPHVKCVLWGHIHQDFELERDGIALIATPSTCIQFLPKSDGFAVHDIAPGYRWLTLAKDGRVASEVRRAEDFEFQLDMQSNGY